MPQRQLAGTTVDVTPEGYFTDPSVWTPAMANEMALELGIDLSEKHWAVIDFCRKDAADKGTAPGLRRISKASGVNMKELYQLFPKGPGKLAAYVAGLPKPKSCV